MFILGRRELIVGLGSNAPDALGMLRAARAALRGHPAFKLRACSPIYRSDALLPPGAPEKWNLPFLNAACRLETTLDAAEAIISALKSIERALGRTEAPRWAPRIIDLDLLAWGGPDVRSERVSVPHPGLQERPFALLPALDCAGGGASHPWRHAHPDRLPLKTAPAAVAWPELVGILNLTPDSFSDGGKLLSVADAEYAARELVAGGATVIDVGAESTRPGSTPVSPEAEIDRLRPALEMLATLKKELGFKLSLDTRHAETAAWCVERFPIDWLNDVEGFASARLRELAARSSCDVVFMHSLGVPPSTDAVLPLGHDPVACLLEWARTRLDELFRAGIPPARLILDPGIGFGKTASQNVELVARARELNALGVRLLIGHSRKRFLDPESLVAAGERDLETAIVTARLANSGVDFLRVHCPATQARALRLGARLG